MRLVVVGAHALDAELMAGAVAAVATEAGWTVELVHLTRGERGHPSEPADRFGPQLEREMAEAASTLGVTAWWAGLPAPLNKAEAIPVLADIMARSRPNLVLTHWRGSWHSSHVAANEATLQAVEVADLDAALAYGENCEDLLGFTPTHVVPVEHVRERWLEALRSYELFRRSEPWSGVDSEIPYWAYYTAALRVRGLQAGVEQAQSFMLARGEVTADLGALSVPS